MSRTVRKKRKSSGKVRDGVDQYPSRACRHNGPCSYCEGAAHEPGGSAGEAPNLSLLDESMRRQIRRAIEPTAKGSIPGYADLVNAIAGKGENAGE